MPTAIGFIPRPSKLTSLPGHLACVRYVYNHFLRQRTDAWFERQERMGYNTTAKALTTLKKQPDTAFLPRYQCLLATVAPASRPRLLKLLQRSGAVSHLQKKQRKQSATYMVNGFRWQQAVAG